MLSSLRRQLAGACTVSVGTTGNAGQMFCNQLSATTAAAAMSTTVAASSPTDLSFLTATTTDRRTHSSHDISSSPPLVSSTTTRRWRSFSFSSATATNNVPNKSNNIMDDSFVTVLKLNMLRDNPGAVKKKRRIGRGIGSSKGKTAGRGHKGQKARAGGSIPLGFEGGQTKFYKLLPKKGFTNKRHKQDMPAINLGTIQDFIDMGRLPGSNDVSEEATTELTLKDFLDAGMCTASSVKHGIKLLAKGKERLTTPIRLKISRASQEAIQAVEAIGGEVTTVHYNQLALRALLKPERFVKLPKFARPSPRLQAYYTNWDEHRGYLSVQAQMRELLRSKPELEDSFATALGKHQEQLPQDL